MIGANASIQGVCFTPRLTDHEQILLPNSLKRKEDRRPDPTKRTQANKERTGKALARSGRFTRTNEVRRRVHAWIDSRGGSTKVKFWTITFPAGTPDHNAFKALNIFFTRWRKIQPEIDYLWTAERQENHTAHFHIVTDLYTDVRILNHFMRTTLKNMGAQIPWSHANQVNVYNGITISPPVFSRLGVEQYLVKYLTKAIGAGFAQPWHCSRNIGTIRTRAQVDRTTAFECIADEIRRASGRNHKVRYMVEDQFIYIPFPSSVNRRIADRLKDENERSWRKRTQSSRSRSHAQHVAHPKMNQSPIVTIIDGVQLTLPLALALGWTPKPRNPTKSRHKVYSWAPVYAASD